MNGVWNVCWMGPCRGVDLGKAGSCRSGVIRALGLHESGQHLHVRLERRKAKVACTLPFLEMKVPVG